MMIALLAVSFSGLLGTNVLVPILLQAEQETTIFIDGKSYFVQQGVNIFDVPLRVNTHANRSILIDTGTVVYEFPITVRMWFPWYVLGIPSALAFLFSIRLRRIADNS